MMCYFFFKGNKVFFKPYFIVVSLSCDIKDSTDISWELGNQNKMSVCEDGNTCFNNLTHFQCYSPFL